MVDASGRGPLRSGDARPSCTPKRDHEGRVAAAHFRGRRKEAQSQADGHAGPNDTGKTRAPVASPRQIARSGRTEWLLPRWRLGFTVSEVAMSNERRRVPRM